MASDGDSELKSKICKGQALRGEVELPLALQMLIYSIHSIPLAIG